MDLNAIRSLSAPDMGLVNETITEQLHSDVALINQLSFYIISGGGKRMRPLLAVLAARAVGYQGRDHVNLAAIIEFIHTATLLHDDVVDESTLRRGRETANALFGNQASVLVGDFLYSRAFQMAVALKRHYVMEDLSAATNVLAEGEVLQLMNCNDADTTEESYMQVIYCKTARLFEAATHLAAVLADQPEPVTQAMADYGRFLGTAFQLVDDVLDYTADADELGKNLGDDLAEGKPTLPLIYAMAHASEADSQRIRAAIEQGGCSEVDEVVTTLNQVGALEYTMKRAEQEADKAIAALDILPDTPYKEALVGLAHIAVDRRS